MNNKILCVDDEESILKGFQLNLRKDFELHMASNGAEGLEVFDRERGFCPCFVGYANARNERCYDAFRDKKARS